MENLNDMMHAMIAHQSSAQTARIIGQKLFPEGTAPAEIQILAPFAEDAAVPATEPQGFCGVTLAMAFAGPAEVDAALAAAKDAGAKVTKPGEATVWGGYSGYFCDPEGFLWEAVHVPQFGLDEQGRLRLPE